MILAFNKIKAVEGLPVDSEIQIGLLSLTVQIDQQYWSVYSRNRALYIVSSDGTGDVSEFDQREIDLPPLVIPRLEVVFGYPRRLQAGEHFNLRARIKNLDDFPIRYIAKLANWYPSDTRTSSFRYLACTSSCTPGGQLPLDPGSTLTLDMGNYYYENPLLESGTLEIPDLTLTMQDDQLRQLSLNSDAEPITIEVEGSFWLVRTADAQIGIPDGATYALDELRIGKLQVGGAYYQLALNFRNAVGGILQLTDLKYLGTADSELDASFKPETGDLTIPKLTAFDSTGPTGIFGLRLTIIPDSNLIYFVIREITPLTDGATQ